jgi:hypothetical protein
LSPIAAPPAYASATTAYDEDDDEDDDDDDAAADSVNGAIANDSTLPPWPAPNVQPRELGEGQGVCGGFTAIARTKPAGLSAPMDTELAIEAGSASPLGLIAKPATAAA